MRSIEFRLLGPLEVEHDGRPVVFGGAKERALLALLLLHASEFVSHDRLIEELWGGSPPQSAKHALQAYVSRLRKTLDAESTEEIIETRPGGYRLRIDPEQLDLRRFERLSVEGRAALAAGEADSAAGSLKEALALWHGSPLDDVAHEPFAPAEVQRLEELWLGAVETRMQAELALRHAAEVIPELELLVARHGLNERLRGQLMLALYRTGRQAEALDLYREGRRQLVQELGIEPGEELRQLQQAILRQDPTLAPVADQGAAREAAVRRPAARFPRRRLVVAALVAVVATAVVVPVLALGSGGPGDRLAGSGLVFLDSSTGRVARVVSLRAPPGSIASDRTALWVTEPTAGIVEHVDAQSGSIIQTVHVGPTTGDIAVGGSAVWVVNPDAGAIIRIDPRIGRVSRVIRVGNNPTALAYGNGSVWVANRHDGTVSRITGRATTTIDTNAASRGLAIGMGSVWTTDETAGRVLRIDPATNTVAHTILVGNGPGAIVAAQGSVWVLDSLDGTVSKIDARTGSTTRTIAVGDAPSAILFAQDAIWVANELNGTVSRITPSGRAQTTFPIGGRPVGLTWADGHVVVAVAAP